MTTLPDAGEPPATIFECDPPEPGQWFAIIDCEWNADFTEMRVRKITVGDDAIIHSAVHGGGQYMILPAPPGECPVTSDNVHIGR